MLSEITDTLVAFGGSLKALGETADGYRVGGYLVVFDSHDASAYQDKFTRETDFDIEDGERTSIYYNHGLDDAIKRTRLGSGRLSIDNAGVWFEGEVKKRTDYLARHIDRIGQGLAQTVEVRGQAYPMFGLSSGAPAHLVERKSIEGGHLITKWPLRCDASITPTPAEPLTACISLKSLLSQYNETSPEALRELEDGLRDGLSLRNHSLKVLDAAKEIVERCAGLAAVRCDRENRRWSEANFASLTHLAHGLESAADSLKLLADAYIPHHHLQAPLSPELQEALLLETQMVLEETSNIQH